MKPPLFLAALWLASAALAADEPARPLVYEQKDAVSVSQLDGTGAKKIAGGQSPDLSPDGTKLAFNTVQDVGQPAHRKIAVADLTSGGVKTFDDIPSDNCLGPEWSPDGSKILFYLYVKQDMRIGIVNADGTGFRFLEKEGVKPHSYWSICWARDGQSIFGQDMESLYQLDSGGAILKKWVISKLVPKGGMSGDIRLGVSPDGTTLLMDVEMDEVVKRKHWDGPLPSVWTLNLATGKAVRLTPKSLLAWDSHWLGADSILFCSEEIGENDPSIYRMGLDGKGKKRLVKNARLPGN